MLDALLRAAERMARLHAELTEYAWCLRHAAVITWRERNRP